MADGTQGVERVVMSPEYKYRATPIRVIDGDTYYLDIDYGFYEHGYKTIRLRGFSCPELRTEEGKRAKQRAEQLFLGAFVIVESYKDQQSFARWIADVYVNGAHIGELLAAEGLATVTP